MTNVLLAAMLGAREIVFIALAIAASLIPTAVIALIVYFVLRDRKQKAAAPSGKTEVVPPPPSPRHCPQCGTALNPAVPEGLCPACLLKHGIATEGGVPPGTPPFTPPPMLELQKLFPQLEILEQIGQGGMGAVYKARQPSLDRLVALKILAPKGGGDLDFAGRFTREARALARLSHPNIVAVYDFGQLQTGGNVSAVSGTTAPPSAPLHYFIMEFVDGMNLRQLEHAGKLTPREALEIIPQICTALQFAHDEGIVHRDIKPENVLLDKKGRVKIADFGLAKIVGQEAKDFRLTGARDVMGTPHYMAPEQVEKPQDVDHRADIYSLGVVFYELLTGELPIGKFQPPSAKVQVDVRLDEVVLRSLAKEPERRYQHASEVKTDVETIAHTPGGARQAVSAQAVHAGAQPSVTQKPDRFWRWMAVAVVALVAIPFFIAILGLLAAIAIPNFVKARNHARVLQEQAGQRSDYVGQEWFPDGDSIQIQSVERSPDRFTVRGTYDLRSRSKALLAFYITTTNHEATTVVRQQLKEITRGHGVFELSFFKSVSGLPHVSMYDNGRPFASVYFGNQEEAAAEAAATWIAAGDSRTRTKPIALWRADGNARDSINNHDGVMDRVGFTDGISGQAFACDPNTYPWGTYTGVKVPDDRAFELTNALSIAGWIRPRGDGYIILCRGDHRPGLDPYQLSMQGNNHLRFYVCEESSQTAFVDTVLNLNEWCYVAGTFDDGLMRLYTNGVLAAETTTSIRPFAKLLPSESPGLGIGNLNDGGNNFPFTGDIDELALYDQALSRDEIRAAYEAGRKAALAAQLPKRSAAGLVASWTADDNSRDHVGRSHGVLMNGAQYAPGVAGDAFQFDGKGAYVKVPPTPALSSLQQQITVEFWMNADVDNEMQNYQGLVTSDFWIVEISNGYGGTMGVNFGLGKSRRPGNLPETIFDGSLGAERRLVPLDRKEQTTVADFVHISDANNGGAAVSAGEWHHIAATYDGEKMQLYVDGQPWGKPKEFSGAISPMLTRSFLSIGSEDGRTTCQECIGKRYFKGLIDEVKVYSRALAPEQIMGDYQRGTLHSRTLTAQQSGVELENGRVTVDSIRSRLAPPTAAASSGSRSERAESAQSVDGVPPVVVETFPISGARDVPPGELEVRVRFSKPMADGSWSWSTAWENSAPEIIGKPRYDADGRTCIAKVKLEPGKTYAWLLNSEKFKNFKDQAGRAAIPYLLTFQTAVEPEKPAVTAAKAWLKVVDSGNYSATWQQASTIFQGGVTEAAWLNSMNTFRKPLGAVVSRSVKSAQETTELPGAPDGQYVLMQFDTSFIAKKSAVETVVFSLEKDGKWKVAGYFIK